MRRVYCCALLAFGLAAVWPESPAFAQDFPFLRGTETVGPATYTRWSGFYFGGQLGLSNGNANFDTSTAPTIAYVLRETALEDEFMPSQWPVLGTANNSALTYGGFVGYNMQWEDVIIGFEANLNRAGFTLNAPSTPIGPLTTAADSFGNTHTVTINANGSVNNFDFAGLRVRAGYVIGNFMPYAFGGPAFAVSTVSIAATVHDLQCSTATPPVCNAFTFNGSNAYNNEVLYGFTVGGGVDVALTPNVFLRAEFEWDQFKPPPGIMMSMATGRVGAGFKF